MAVDVYIHVLVGASESDLAYFNSHNIGSDYFRLSAPPHDTDAAEYRRIEDTPRVFIGEASWLKAALSGSNDHVPAPVKAVTNLFEHDLALIDDAFIRDVRDAFALPNEPGYYDVSSSAQGIIDFLERYKGQRAFTISW